MQASSWGSIQPVQVSPQSGQYISGTSMSMPNYVSGGYVQGGAQMVGVYTTGAYIPTGKQGAGCENQECAEEECDPEECGDENRPPRDDNYTCGIDRRPMLPVVLATSTLLGALCMVLLELPLTRKMLGSAYVLDALFLVLYAVTMSAMAYCALCDPGTLRLGYQTDAYATVKDNQADPAEGNGGPKDVGSLPRRAHKTWLYKSPVRRYDHYCRWLTNVIALLNHREFVVVLVGLVTIGAAGALLDVVLAVDMMFRGASWATKIFLVLHLAYSCILLCLATPIFRIHLGLISRNELAAEWKRNDFYVVKRLKTGEVVAVNSLEDEEFNELFDNFCYDSKKNPFDEGLPTNCWKFWCTPRWPEYQLGEF